MMIVPGLKIPEPEHKHAYALWLFSNELSIFGTCSACDTISYGAPSNYCPTCGALMLNKYDALEYSNTLVKERMKNDD